MANYPAAPIDNSTQISENTHDRRGVVDTADSGAIRGRVAMGPTVFDANVRHRFISGQELSELRDFYRDYKGYSFTFTHGSDAYTMQFTQPLSYRRARGDWWDADTFMKGTLNG